MKKAVNLALLASSFILLANLIFRFWDEAKLLKYFPLDYTNDISSYMAQLHFLKVCGFHGFCQYWYNGFTAFLHSPPGWYFFAYPFYILAGDVKVATYIVMILQFIIAFAVVFYLGKFAGWSKIKRIAFFFFMFANALAIGSFMRLGRLHEMLAWIFFLIIAFAVFWYKDREIDWKFYLLAIPYALTILTYQSVGVFATFLFVSIFLAKGLKGKLASILTVGAGLLLSAFWWLPFVGNISQSASFTQGYEYFAEGRWIWIFTKENLFTNIAATAAAVAFFAAFYLYWKSKNKPKELIIFMSPFLIFNFLFLIRLTPLLPVIKYIFPDPVIIFAITMALFCIFNTDFEKLGVKTAKPIAVLIVLISLSSVFISITHTPLFAVPGGAEQDIMSLFPDVEGRFMMLGDFPRTSYAKAYSAYGPIYYGISAAYGWYPQSKEAGYFLLIDETMKAFDSRQCSAMKESLDAINTTEVISYGEGCSFFAGCGFEEKAAKNSACLYSSE